MCSKEDLSSLFNCICEHFHQSHLCFWMQADLGLLHHNQASTGSSKELSNYRQDLLRPKAGILRHKIGTTLRIAVTGVERSAARPTTHKRFEPKCIGPITYPIGFSTILWLSKNSRQYSKCIFSISSNT